MSSVYYTIPQVPGNTTSRPTVKPTPMPTRDDFDQFLFDMEELNIPWFIIIGLIVIIIFISLCCLFCWYRFWKSHKKLKRLRRDNEIKSSSNIHHPGINILMPTFSSYTPSGKKLNGNSSPFPDTQMSQISTRMTRAHTVDGYGVPSSFVLYYI